MTFSFLHPAWFVHAVADKMDSWEELQDVGNGNGNGAEFYRMDLVSLSHSNNSSYTLFPL